MGILFRCLTQRNCTELLTAHVALRLFLLTLLENAIDATAKRRKILIGMHENMSATKLQIEHNAGMCVRYQIQMHPIQLDWLSCEIFFDSRSVIAWNFCFVCACARALERVGAWRISHLIFSFKFRYIFFVVTCRLIVVDYIRYTILLPASSCALSRYLSLRFDPSLSCGRSFPVRYRMMFSCIHIQYTYVYTYSEKSYGHKQMYV